MRPLKPWEGSRASARLSEDEIIALFKKRRRAAVASFLFMLIGMLLPHILQFVLHADALKYFEKYYLGPYIWFVILGSFVAVFLIIKSHRCPRCLAIPSTNRDGYTQSVLMFPKRCGNCGAPLMPNHPYGQEP